MFKKSLLILVSIFIIGISISVLSANDDVKGVKDHGKQVKDIMDESLNTDNIVHIIDDQGNEEFISQLDLDTYVLNKEFIGKSEVIEKDALEELVDSKILYMEAVQLGYKITNEEVEETINTNKEIINNNQEHQIFLQNYLEGLNLSEEEYWRLVKKAYEKSLTVGKYKNSELKDSFEANLTKENKNYAERSENYNKEFKDYTKNHIKDFKEKSGITVQYLK